MMALMNGLSNYFSPIFTILFIQVQILRAYYIRQFHEKKSLKYGGFGAIFFRKILCMSHIELLLLLTSGKNSPPPPLQNKKN
jgi:hypothetical protein